MNPEQHQQISIDTDKREATPNGYPCLGIACSKLARLGNIEIVAREESLGQVERLKDCFHHLRGERHVPITENLRWLIRHYSRFCEAARERDARIVRLRIFRDKKHGDKSYTNRSPSTG